jgi:uncharacterized membrane protein YeaQ/YmgE (transglycosylase-associated protein family)
MQILLLFVLGGSLGLIASFSTGIGAHLPRFNNVAIAIIGALVGGMLLPRSISHVGSGNLMDIASTLLASIVAVIFLATLIAFRRKFDGRV